MVPTTRFRSLAVVPPPPSYDPSSYEPFDDEVSRTIDQILNEEAGFESSKDEDWPVYSGGDSSSASSRPTPHRDKDVKESRFFSQPPTSDDTKLKAGKRKPVAKRNITVIDLDSDRDGDSAVAPEPKGQESEEAADDVPDGGNEADNDSPMDNSKGGKMKAVGKRDTTVVGLQSDGEEDTAAPPEPDGQEPQDQEPKEAMGDVPDDGNEAGNDSPMDNQVQNDVDVSMDIWDPLSQGVDRVAEPTIGDEATDAEEDAIFASVDLSQRNHLLHYLVSHPFMQNSVQPVARSARRSFVKAMRQEATTAGMDEPAVDRLIEYVRKVYLEDLGVNPHPLPGDLSELPFGEEIDDDHLEEARRRKSHKRKLDSGERTESKKKRKKGDKKHLKEMSGPSLQSALQQEVSERTQAAKSSPEDPPKHQEDEKDALSSGPRGDPQTMDAGSMGNDISNVTEKGDHALDDAAEQMIQYEKLVALEKQHTRDATAETNGKSGPLEKRPVRESGPYGANENPPALEKSIVTESSHSEPDLPPNHAQLRRGSTDKGNKKARKEEPLKASKARKASQSIEIHADENTSPENQPSLPSKPESVPKPVRETSITTLEANQNVHREEQPRDVKESSKEDKENGAQDASADIVPESPPAETEREIKPEPVENLPKKSANWKKKQRKKSKKRHSHLALQENPQTDKQAPGPQSVPQPQAPVSIPDPVTPKKSSKKSRFSELSPNPAEWDLDF